MIMVEAINPVPPGATPMVGRKQSLDHSRPVFLRQCQGTLIHHQRKTGVVRIDTIVQQRVADHTGCSEDVLETDVWM
jgi:hypothetical protein